MDVQWNRKRPTRSSYCNWESKPTQRYGEFSTLISFEVRQKQTGKGSPFPVCLYADQLSAPC